MVGLELYPCCRLLQVNYGWHYKKRARKLKPAEQFLKLNFVPNFM